MGASACPRRRPLCPGSGSGLCSCGGAASGRADCAWHRPFSGPACGPPRRASPPSHLGPAAAHDDAAALVSPGPAVRCGDCHGALTDASPLIPRTMDRDGMPVYSQEEEDAPGVSIQRTIWVTDSPGNLKSLHQVLSVVLHSYVLCSGSSLFLRPGDRRARAARCGRGAGAGRVHRVEFCRRLHGPWYV